MRGWEDVTRKSGWTYTDSVKVWSRIDSWWVSGGVKATLDRRTGDVPAPFTRHKGVGIEIEIQGGTEEVQQEGVWSVPVIPPKTEVEKWSRFYDRVGERLARELERGAQGDGVMAAWDMAAREELGEKRAGRRVADKANVPARYMPISVWGHSKQEGGRMWKALKKIQKEKGTGDRMPDLRKEGVKLQPEDVLKEAQEKWGALFTHPREGENWDEDVWNNRLERIREVVAQGGPRAETGELLTWEEFLAYIRALPEGKAGWGFLRYDMLKEAQEQHLRVWFDKVMIPLLKGGWTPGDAVKRQR